jgi:hypothetical protein
MSALKALSVHGSNLRRADTGLPAPPALETSFVRDTFARLSGRLPKAYSTTDVMATAGMGMARSPEPVPVPGPVPGPGSAGGPGPDGGPQATPQGFVRGAFGRLSGRRKSASDTDLAGQRAAESLAAALGLGDGDAGNSYFSRTAFGRWSGRRQRSGSAGHPSDTQTDSGMRHGGPRQPSPAPPRCKR